MQDGIRNGSKRFRDALWARISPTFCARFRISPTLAVATECPLSREKQGEEVDLGRESATEGRVDRLVHHRRGSYIADNVDKPLDRLLRRSYIADG